MERSGRLLGRVTRRVTARVVTLTLGVTIAGCGPSQEAVIAANEESAIRCLASIFYAAT